MTFYTVKSLDFSATDATTGGLGEAFCEEIGDAATGGGYDLRGIFLPVTSRPIIDPVTFLSGWQVFMDDLPTEEEFGLFDVYVVCADAAPPHIP